MTYLEELSRFQLRVALRSIFFVAASASAAAPTPIPIHQSQPATDTLTSSPSTAKDSCIYSAFSKYELRKKGYSVGSPESPELRRYTLQSRQPRRLTLQKIPTNQSATKLDNDTDFTKAACYYAQDACLNKSKKALKPFTVPLPAVQKPGQSCIDDVSESPQDATPFTDHRFTRARSNTCHNAKNCAKSAERKMSNAASKPKASNELLTHPPIPPVVFRDNQKPLNNSFSPSKKKYRTANIKRKIL